MFLTLTAFFVPHIHAADLAKIDRTIRKESAYRSQTPRYGWTREEAIEAGRKGGKASHAKGVAHRFNSETGCQAAKSRKAKRSE